MKAKIRKLMVVVDETMVEMNRKVSPPTRRAAAVAVIENPFAGRRNVLSDRQQKRRQRVIRHNRGR